MDRWPGRFHAIKCKKCLGIPPTLHIFMIFIHIFQLYTHVIQSHATPSQVDNKTTRGKANAFDKKRINITRKGLEPVQMTNGYTGNAFLPCFAAQRLQDLQQGQLFLPPFLRILQGQIYEFHHVFPGQMSWDVSRGLRVSPDSKLHSATSVWSKHVQATYGPLELHLT